MAKVKCYSVRLESLISISEKAYKATCFDGSTAIIPKSQVFGTDFEVQKSDAYWISAWILDQKELQYSSKKVSYFDTTYSNVEGVETIVHVPEEKQAVEIQAAKELCKDEILTLDNNKITKFQELFEKVYPSIQNADSFEGVFILNGKKVEIRKHWSDKKWHIWNESGKIIGTLILKDWWKVNEEISDCYIHIQYATQSAE